MRLRTNGSSLVGSQGVQKRLTLLSAAIIMNWIINASSSMKHCLALAAIERAETSPFGIVVDNIILRPKM